MTSGPRATVALLGTLGAVVAGCGSSPGRAPYGIDARPANPTCVAPARPAAPGTVQVQRVFNTTVDLGGTPIELAQPPGDASTWYVALKNGVVKKFPNKTPLAAADITTAIDLTAKVNSGASESGLLGLAFHPNFAGNKQVFLSYTAFSASSAANLRSTVSRFTESGGVLGGESVVMPGSDAAPNLLDQPFNNHNGGHIAFGKDGLLYFGLGDGGAGGDPGDRALDLTQLLGKLLRVDVDNTGGQRYGIPATNPYKNGGGRPEIYAYGLRNPWRFSFDRSTGELWLGDVGQGAYEEIDLVKLGGNYGWDDREGKHCFEPMNGCLTAGRVDPVVEYSHTGGRCSIVGGYVYRGAAMPDLAGTYFYSDTCSGELFSIGYDAMGQPQHTTILDAGIGTYSFAQDTEGELYLVGGGGQILKLIPTGTPQPDTFPKTLSATGCVDAADAKKPARGLIPYDVNAPLWSDGADKERFLALPDGATITVNGDGDLDLPNGSVLMKTFLLGGKRVETRLFMRHDDGAWAGYSYAWNDAQTDATLLRAGSTQAVGAQTWTFPSRAECLVCHTAQAGRTLGLEVGQLNREFVYTAANRLSNQLATLDHIGLFSTPLGDPKALTAFADPFGAAPVDARARSYLHANCAFCHRPMGTGRGLQDLRYDTPLGMAKLCNELPTEGDVGVTGARLILPGDPARSIVPLRMRLGDVNRMPPLASLVVDDKGAKVIEAFIQSLMGCP